MDVDHPPHELFQIKYSTSIKQEQTLFLKAPFCFQFPPNTQKNLNLIKLLCKILIELSKILQMSAVVIQMTFELKN